MFYPFGGNGTEDKGVYENKYLFDRLKEMELVATQNQNAVTTTTTLTPADVSELFFEGDKLVWRHLDDFSLGVFSLDHPVRQLCVHVMLNKWFDRFILVAICGNALTLAANNPLDNTNEDFYLVMEHVFNVIFLVEFVIKLVCLGGWGVKSGYYRDSWNRMDCLVLICGWLPVCLAAFGVQGVNNFSFIRVFRILKVLKTINTIPGLKRLVQAVLDAIPQLVSVANLLTIIFFLFGILGTQLFQGTLRRRCFPAEVSEGYVPSDDLCSRSGDLGAVSCPADTPMCSEYIPDTRSPNPNLNEFSNFDNTPVSFLTIFVAISLEGWSSVMFSILETSGATAIIYFIILVIIGAYFVINLVIAVIYQSYVDTIDEWESHESSFRHLVMMEMEEVKAQGQAGGGQGTGINLRRLPSRAIQSQDAGGRQVELRRQASGENRRELRRQLTTEGGGRILQLHRQKSLGRQLSRQHSRAGEPSAQRMQGQYSKQYSKQYSRQLSRQYSRQYSTQYSPSLSRQLSRQCSMRPLDAAPSPLSLTERLFKRDLLGADLHLFFTENENYQAFKTSCQYIVSRQSFDLFIVLVILFNIVVLSIQANGTSERNDVFIEVSNIVFTLFFCLELVIQAVASDIIPYLSNGYNLLDVLIVIVGIIDIFYRGSSTSLSVFRTLRVFRTFKLFKRWESLQELIRAIFISGEGLGYFCVVLLLFLFVFALTGVSLFAGKLPANSRTDFDTLFSAFVTTFQLVTGENWNEVLYETMEYSPAIGAVFCITVYTLGTLVVLNIFLAILLETFSNVKNNNDSYYDKLDAQTSFQSSVRAVWKRFVVTVKSIYGRLVKRDKVSSGGDEKTDDNSLAKERESYFSSNSTPGQGSFKRVSLASKSNWIGWSDLDHGDSNVGSDFLEDDVWCRRVLSTISVGQYRRGGVIYSDCFTAAEVVDCLLDHEIVDNVKMAVIMGQELLFQKNLLPVYVEMGDMEEKYEREMGREAAICKLMSPRKKDLRQVNREYASMISMVSRSTVEGGDAVVELEKEEEEEEGSDGVSSVGSSNSSTCLHKKVGFFADPEASSRSLYSDLSEEDEPCHPASPLKQEQPNISEYNSKLRKLSSSMDTHFMDDKSLYRLNLQGEQVTEWLLNSKHSEKELKKLKLQRILQEKKSIMVGHSFGVFGPDNCFREFCTSLVTHKYFEYVVLVVIVGSSICLAIDEPGIEPNSAKYQALNITDYAFTVFFVLEMLVKMVSKGVFGSKKSYFSSGWNVLDFVIVIISVTSLALVSWDLSYLKAFRALRSLRPLRMVSRSPALKAVVNAIIMVTTPLANFTLVICVFLFTFAILGTSLFKDKFVYCRASSLQADVTSIDADEFVYQFNRAECTGNTTNADGNLVSLEWATRDSNFDNVSRALLTLFELITMEAWPRIMHPAMDIPDSGHDHPEENHSKYNALFFIVFIVVGAFFITNLFVGIIVYKFRSARENSNGSALLTDVQQNWLNDIKIAMTAKPRRHSTLPNKDALCGWKRPIHLLVNNETFMLCMDALIIVNILVMALEHFNQSDIISRIIFVSNELFTAIFTVEILLRFVAVTPKEFIAEKWNRIDSAIVLAALVDSVGGSLVVNVTIFRVFRVARLFRLIKDSKDMIVLVKTLYFSLPSLINVGTLLSLSFFVFAVVGMNLFGDSEKDGELFNQYANFDGFFPSMLLLFKCMTGEDWNATMYLLKNQGYDVAVPFFALFLLVNKYMLLNLFIAIILENFEAALRDDPAKVAHRNLEDFIQQWSNIRKDIGSEDDDCMPSYCLVKILHSLDPPLGIRGTKQANLALRTADDRQVYRRYLLSLIRSLDLKEDSTGRVFFVDVVSALVRRGHTAVDGEITSVAENMSVEQRHELLSELRHLTRKRRMSKLEKKMKGKMFTEIDLAVEINSAMYVQAIWRGCLNRKKLRETMVRAMLQNNNAAPKIMLNRTDSKKLQAMFKQAPGSAADTKVRKALKILKLGSESFSFVQSQAVMSDSDVSTVTDDCDFGTGNGGAHNNVSRPQPLHIDAGAEVKVGSGSSTPTRLLSRVRSASSSVFQPFTRYVGGSAAPSSPVMSKRNSSKDLSEISASSGDDFNYFTVFEDKDECLVLTHVNSQRHIMENLFTAQEKKKKKQQQQILRKQSTLNVPEGDFKDLDVYVLRPKSPHSTPSDEDQFHL